MIYRIKDWRGLYETSETRKLATLPWIKLRTKINGDYYTELVRTHEDGPKHFAAWVSMLQVAANSKDRGALVRDDKTPHTPQSLYAKTGIPADWFEGAIPRLVAIGWIEEEAENGTNVPPIAEKQQTAGQTSHNQKRDVHPGFGKKRDERPDLELQNGTFIPPNGESRDKPPGPFPATYKESLEVRGLEIREEQYKPLLTQQLPCESEPPDDQTFQIFYERALSRNVLQASGPDWTKAAEEWKRLTFDEQMRASIDVRERPADSAELRAPALPANYLKQHKFDRPMVAPEAKPPGHDRNTRINDFFAKYAKGES